MLLNVVSCAVVPIASVTTLYTGMAQVATRIFAALESLGASRIEGGGGGDFLDRFFVGGMVVPKGGNE